MTFKELAKLVANDFRSTMAEEGFETFKEMKECYWWTSGDIKEEIGAIIDNAKVGAYLSDDGADVFIGDEFVTYRSFNRMVMNKLKSDEDEEEE